MLGLPSHTRNTYILMFVSGLEPVGVLLHVEVSRSLFLGIDTNFDHRFLSRSRLHKSVASYASGEIAYKGTL